MAKVTFELEDSFAARRDLAALQHDFEVVGGSLVVVFEDVDEQEALFIMIKASTSHGFRSSASKATQKAEPVKAPHEVAHEEALRLDAVRRAKAQKDAEARSAEGKLAPEPVKEEKKPVSAPKKAEGK